MDLNKKILKEVLDRLIRIETRFTRYLVERGFDTGAEKPVMISDTMVSVPSPNVRLSDLLDTIPLSLSETDIAVFVGEDHVCTITRGISYDR